MMIYDSVQSKTIFLIYVVGTQKNHLNDNGSFVHPKQMLKLMDKKIFTIYF